MLLLNCYDSENKCNMWQIKYTCTQIYSTNCIQVIVYIKTHGCPVLLVSIVWLFWRVIKKNNCLPYCHNPTNHNLSEDKNITQPRKTQPLPFFSYITNADIIRVIFHQIIFQVLKDCNHKLTCYVLWIWLFSSRHLLAMWNAGATLSVCILVNKLRSEPVSRCAVTWISFHWAAMLDWVVVDFDNL